VENTPNNRPKCQNTADLPLAQWPSKAFKSRLLLPHTLPLRTSETLPEHEYEGHFFRRRPKKVKITPPAVLFPNHSYNSILYSVSLSGNRTGRTEAGFFLVSVQEICQPKKTLFPSFPSCNHYRSGIPAGAHHLVLGLQVISLHQYRSRSYRSRYTPRDRTSSGIQSV
jgi:hypothetical protein